MCRGIETKTVVLLKGRRAGGSSVGMLFVEYCVKVICCLVSHRSSVKQDHPGSSGEDSNYTDSMGELGYTPTHSYPGKIRGSGCS